MCYKKHTGLCGTITWLSSPLSQGCTQPLWANGFQAPQRAEQTPLQQQSRSQHDHDSTLWCAWPLQWSWGAEKVHRDSLPRIMTITDTLIKHTVFSSVSNLTTGVNAALNEKSTSSTQASTKGPTLQKEERVESLSPHIKLWLHYPPQ